MATYESYGRPDVHKSLSVMFKTPMYFDYWPTISQRYRDFEFADELSDAMRMEEYASVYQQLRKFIGSKMATVMGMQDNLDSLLAYLKDQLERCDVYPKTRVDMVYTSLKIDWIHKAITQVSLLIEELNRS